MRAIGTVIEGKQQNSRFDGENYVIDVVVRAMESNKGGMRDAIKASAV